MEDITHYPLLVLAITFFGLWTAARGGLALRRRSGPLNEGLREDFNVILGATLTLLGLIIAFTFSMATTRYDLRKSYEEAEANAIGTEYVRADLLSPADAATVRAQLRDYLDLRVAFYTGEDMQSREQSNARTSQLQAALWSTVRGAAALQATSITALVVAGMNDVLNTQGYTQAAYWNRIPTAAWALMAAIAICCNVLLGFGSSSPRTSSKLFLVVPLMVSISFMLIADIDSPRHGVIRVVPQNLISLAASLRP